MSKKIALVIGSVLVLVLTIYILSKNDKEELPSYRPCVYFNNQIYWESEYITEEFFQEIPVEQLSIVGITKEVVGRLPEKQEEAAWESGKEIIYDSINDCIYIHYELTEPAFVNESGYAVLRKMN